MDPSPFQTLKLELISELYMSRDAFHIYIGLGCLLLFGILSRRGFATFWALLPGLLVSLLLEGIDLHDDLGFYGYPRWRASLHDVFHTNLAPLLLVLTARWSALRRRRG